MRKILIFSLLLLFLANGILTAKDLKKDYQSSQIYTLNLILTPYTGSNNPKIEIVVYSDFFCSHCRYFLGILEELLKDPKYKESVRVYYKIFPLSYQKCKKEFPLKDWNDSCKVGLILTDFYKKGLFWELEKELRNISAKNLMEVIQTAEKMTQKRINLEELKKQNTASIIRQIEEAFILDIQATPTWFLNGRKIEGSYPLDDLKSILDDLIKESK